MNMWCLPSLHSASYIEAGSLLKKKQNTYLALILCMCVPVCWFVLKTAYSAYRGHTRSPGVRMIDGPKPSDVCVANRSSVGVARALNCSRLETGYLNRT